MGWRAAVLAELEAGQPAALLGIDIPDKTEREWLLDSGIVTLGHSPEPGEELLLATPRGPLWCQVVPGELSGSAYYAYPNCSQSSHWSNSSRRNKQAAAFTFEAEDLQALEFDRTKLYRLLARELGCRTGLEQAAPGLWILGAATMPGGGRARVYLVERGVSVGTIESALHRCAFKTACLLRTYPGSELATRQLGLSTGKALLEGALEVSPAGMFAAPCLEELEALALEEKRGAWIDRGSTPPVLVVGDRKFKLRMFGNQPALGVLLLEYLFDHPREPISCWDLERKVCTEKEALQADAGTADEMLDAKAERDLAIALRAKSAELAELEVDDTASEFERESVREELEELRQHYLETHLGKGRKRLLGNTDSEKARRRVRKALDAQIEAVREQSPSVADLLESAIGKGNTVQFLPPPEWGV